MMEQKLQTDIIASTFLGKKVEGVFEYKPELLVAVPRFENRLKYNIEDNNLPFTGWDVWHCYEFSALTKNGFPVTGVLKLSYPCNSKFIIESKSLKLYLNSFNMTKIGINTQDCLNKSVEIIKKDLSKILQTNVDADFIDINAHRVDIFSGYKNMMDFVNESELYISEYKENPNILRLKQHSQTYEYFYKYDSLRSNCRITHQPDFGDIFIYYKSKKEIIPETLVSYLVSFRNEYHFHEECCEMIFKRLYDILDEGDSILVTALYTRRGGIDISPIRHSKDLNIKFVQDLKNTKIFARYGLKQ